MARLIPPGELQRKYWVNAEGSRVKKGTPGAIEKVWTNSKYYIAYWNGKNETRVAAYRDKRASEKRKQNIEESLERGQEGLVDPYKEHRDRDAVEHLEEYLPQLKLEVSNEKYFA